MSAEVEYKTYYTKYYTTTGMKVREVRRPCSGDHKYNTRSGSIIPRGYSHEDCKIIIAMLARGMSRNAIKNQTRYTQWGVTKVCCNRDEILKIIGQCQKPDEAIIGHEDIVNISLE